MNIIIAVAISALMIGGATLLSSSEYGGDDGFLGATSYPTSLDSFTNPSATDKTNSPSHADQHSNANDAIEALEAKVGADSSAVTTSHDYKLSTVTGSDKAASVAGIQTLLNKTLTSPLMTNATSTVFASASSTFTGSTTINSSGFPFKLTLGSDATGDVFYRNSSGNIARLGIGSEDNFLRVSSGLPVWSSVTATAPAGSVNATTTASTTIAVTADGTDFIQVYAYGSGNNTTGAVASQLELTLGGTVLDEFEITMNSNQLDFGWTLTWFGTPAATTSTFTIQGTNINAIEDATIIYYKY